MSEPQGATMISNLTDLAHALSEATAIACRKPRLNTQLADVRDLTGTDPTVIEAALSDDPVKQLAAFELTESAGWLNRSGESRIDFLRHFRQPSPPERLIYLGLNRHLEEWPEFSSAIVTQRDNPAAQVAFIQRVLNWALQFCHHQPHDVRDLRRINLHYPFAAAVLDPPTGYLDKLMATVLHELGIEIIWIDEPVADHNLGNWIGERLGLSGSSVHAKQTQLGFTEAGGTRNSLFVVRAMGGVDGYEVRGTVGEDLALVIDIGDREVSKAATAYLEKYVVKVINEQTDFSAEADGNSLRLRWYDTRLSAEDLAEALHKALKKQFILKTIAVNLIFDPLRIASLTASILGYRDERETELARRSEESAPMVICRDYNRFAPHCFEVASVDCPPPSGRSYDEVATLAQFTRGMDFFLIDQGINQDRHKGSYLGINKFVRLFSEGNITSVGLHSLRENPLPCVPNPECIAWYLREHDVMVIISRDYEGRTPDGKTFDAVLKKVAGQQVPGFAGIAEEYINSPRFFSPEGGISRIAWMNSSLLKRLGLKIEHILTEEDCINLAGLKDALATWRH